MNVSDIIAIVGLLVALAGIPITFILARRTRLRPQLRHAVNFDVILNPGDKLFDLGLYMRLGSRQINRISRTRIALWNHRGDTIHSADILVADPLRIQLAEGDEALQARVLSASRRQIGIAVQIDPENPTSIPVTFDFLDTWDGAVLEIIHKGPRKPSLEGTLQGSDIYNAGAAALGPEALKAVAEKSRIRRFRTYAWRRNKEIWLIFAALIVLISALAAVVFAMDIGLPNHLIDVNHYNLHTIKGQVGFAKAVSKTSAFNGSSTRLIDAGILVAVVGLIGLAAAGFYRSTRAKIPVRIVTYTTMQKDNQAEITPDRTSESDPEKQRAAPESAANHDHEVAPTGTTNGHQSGNTTS